MQITVDKVRVGDFINNFGIVTEIKYFYRNEAVVGRTAQKEKGGFSPLDYARLVEEQQERSYNQVLDQVVMYSGFNKKTFSAESILDIIRIKEAA